MRMLETRIGWALIAMGILLPLCSWVYLRTRNEMPVNESIELRPGVHYTEFRVNLASQYCVSLELQPVLPIEEISCMLGAGEGVSDGNKCKEFPAIDLTWQIRRGGTEVGVGSPAKHDIMQQHDTIEANYGCVNLAPGRYDLALALNGSGTALQLAKPRLQVYAYAFAERRFGFALFLVSGAVLVCVGGMVVFLFRIRRSYD